ncbi:RING finger protein 10 [Anopheles maculipalpis]|uniref:RING finger protein 10 n=1 Tax=Anopheles maculipalpis TaxID=1496333 RepID=UPI0021590F1C|nr:RING finger protein 10 [Anopheles maculipalpis]
MEKNRFTNQNLSKGQISETKKNQDVSVKWPRQSKRRGEQSDSSNNNNNHRNGTNTGKVPNANKNRNQSNFNYDARQRSQRPIRASEQLPTGDGESGSGSLAEEQSAASGTTGLAAPSRPNTTPTSVRGELHSVFTPGSKKQSLNHLLNYHYAPRDRDQPVRFTRTGNIRKLTNQSNGRYNKEQFLQANCQFVVRAGEDYEGLLAAPDQLVDWGKVEQIHVLSSEEPQCPICLYPPVAAKMTKCGHVYCWPCILHYLALSDKTWRKCPICYEAIHLPDLRSAVSKPFHAFGTGEYVTLQLMRREKGTMKVVEVGDDMEVGVTRPVVVAIPHFDATVGNSILTKLLLTDTVQMLKIMEREQTELENQLVSDGAEAPENMFVQQALDILGEKRSNLMASKAIIFPAPAEKTVLRGTSDEGEQAEVQSADSHEDTHDGTSDEASSSDFMIDEESNFTVGDIDIVPTAQCAGQHYYFYQSLDGQPLFLHSINSRMLQAMYGSLDRSPHRITGRVVQKDSCSMDENLRRRLKYLEHLPVCTQFDVVELDFGPTANGNNGLVSEEVLSLFHDELSLRQRTRQKRARAEQKREKQIFEFNERQLGKAMARSARISIESTKQFPSCGLSESFPDDPTPFGTSPVASDISSSPGSSGSVVSSWSKMVSTQPSSSHRWPSLGGGGASSSMASANSAPAPKLVQVTGSRMTVTTSRTTGGWRQPASSDIDEDETDEELIAARAPRFNNNLGRAIEAALERKVSQPNHQSSTTTASGSGSGPGQAAGKRKKNKKTLLFASGMNLN